MKDKAIVLLSAGLDSSYNLYRASGELEVVLCLSFDYGQRAAARELERAGRLAARFGVRHEVVPFVFLKNLGGSSLTDPAAAVPTKEVSIDDMDASRRTAASVWVPNRNGLFLNAAACFADRYDAKWVIPGFNKEEATTFPDNSTAFMESLDRAFSFSTKNGVRVKCYSDAMTKTEIVRDGIALGMNFGELWPCYFAYDKWCGECESCRRSRRALEANGVPLLGLFR